MNITLESLIPNSIRNEPPDVARRARAVVIAAGIVSFVATYIAWVQFAGGSHLIAGGALALAICSAVGAEYARRSGRWQSVGIGVCAGIFAVAGAVVAITGGTMPAASFYLGLVPVVATIFFGARAGAAAVVLNIVFLSAIELLRRSGFEFPLWIPEEVAARSAYRGAMIFEGILFAMAVVYDILRRASLSDVAESEARYQVLRTQSTDLVFELDRNAIVRHVSNEHAAALGWTPEEVLGRPSSDFVHDEDQSAVDVLLRRAVQDGTWHGDDTRLLHRDGSWHWYGPSATAFQAPDREPRVMVVARNLDSRLDTEMQQRQAQKMDAVGQLASGVAHDFNNLLMVVGSYAQMLAEDLPDGEQREAAREILHASEQGEALTRQLVAVSRPASHTPEPTNPNAVIRRSERILTKIAGENVRVEFALDPEVPAVVADSGHLDQILVNLTVNARDAMPDGGVLRIQTSSADGWVRIQVADSGGGIDPEIRDRVFEAFFTTKSRQHGTGLGLYVVYALVQQMRGRIEIDSEVDAGTTVTVAIPGTRERASLVPNEAGEMPLVGGGSETILLVEDRSQLREIVAKTLSKAGYQVVEASNGAEAIERARSLAGPMELVLSDVVMPGMSGPEMARALRADFPSTRFLFMSGHPERARELAEELSDDTLILKPIAPPELLRRVREALDRPS